MVTAFAVKKYTDTHSKRNQQFWGNSAFKFSAEPGKCTRGDRCRFAHVDGGGGKGSGGSGGAAARPELRGAENGERPGGCGALLRPISQFPTLAWFKLVQSLVQSLGSSWKVDIS